MKVTASLNYLRISPRKVRVVVDAVRGLAARDAVAQLSFLNKRAARDVQKLISSAIANAEHNFSLDPESLKISSIKVNEGPRLKRFKAKGMGRAGLIERKTSHILLELEGERGVEKAARKEEKIAVAERPQDVIIESGEGTQEEQAGTLRQAEKKIGQKKKDSFTRRFFQRKSV